MSRTSFNKSAWIREQPASLSAKDVVAKAAAAGISLTSTMVYNVRASAKKAGIPVAARTVEARFRARPARTIDASSLHVQFQKLSVRLGTEESQRLLARLPSLVLAQL